MLAAQPRCATTTRIAGRQAHRRGVLAGQPRSRALELREPRPWDHGRRAQRARGRGDMFEEARRRGALIRFQISACPGAERPLPDREAPRGGPTTGPACRVTPRSWHRWRRPRNASRPGRGVRSGSCRRRPVQLQLPLAAARILGRVLRDEPHEAGSEASHLAGQVTGLSQRVHAVRQMTSQRRHAVHTALEG